MTRNRKVYFVAATVLVFCCLFYLFVNVIVPVTVIYDYGPDWSSWEQKVVFICNRPTPDFTIFDPPRDGEIPHHPQNSEICVMASDGSQRAYLTDNKEKDTDPKFSPDDNHIAFIRTWQRPTNLYLMNSDGSQQHQISSVNDVKQFAWSLDSSMIAFTTYAKGDLYVLDLATSVARRLLTGTIETIAWSPDSQRIAYVSRMQDQCELHIVTADAGRESVSPIQSGCQDITWSPNGKYVAFSGRQTVLLEGRFPFALKLETEEIITLAHTKQLMSGGFVWSPDSERVYYLAVGEVFVASTDGSGATQLTNLGSSIISYANLHNLAISPDGKQLVFSRVGSGSSSLANAKIWKINTDGSGLQQLSP